MTSSEAGCYYVIRMRLRGQIAHQKWTLGKPWTQSQEEAWQLLNEVEHLVNLLQAVGKSISPDDHSELASQIRGALKYHLPACKSRG